MGTVVVYDGVVWAGEDSVEGHSVVVGGAGVVDLDGAVLGSLLFEEMSLFKLEFNEAEEVTGRAGESFREAHGPDDNLVDG